MSELINRVGECNKNSFGTKMIIIRYDNHKNIWVEFQDEYKTIKHTNYVSFTKGFVKNPFDKIFNNIGYIGIGKYNCVNHNKMYGVWRNMIARCYDPYIINKNITYKDCVVDERFHCFQDFCKWFDENYYTIENETMALDKDILVKGNKTYSPETCVFVPQRINS